MENVVIFDAGTLISFSMSSLYEELRKLKGTFKGKFLVTPQVKQEIIDKPLKVRRFELEALKTKALLEDGILELSSSMVSDSEVLKETENLLNVANSSFVGAGKTLKIIDAGEASCVALSKILNAKKIKNVIAVDERTTRVLIEKPDNLKELLRRKMRVEVSIKKSDFKIFKGIGVIRSAELTYMIWKKGLMRIKDDNVLEALLYAVKTRGCAISNEEIQSILSMSRKG